MFRMPDSDPANQSNQILAASLYVKIKLVHWFMFAFWTRPLTYSADYISCVVSLCEVRRIHVVVVQCGTVPVDHR